MVPAVKHQLEQAEEIRQEAARRLETVPTPEGVKSPSMGQMPLPAGAVINAKELQPEELHTLQQIPGWKPGDPIPTNLAGILAEARKEALAHVAPELPPGAVPGQLPKRDGGVFNYEDLSPEKKREIDAAMAQAKEIDEMPANMAPGVREMLSGENIRQVDLNVVDDVSDKPQASVTGLGRHSITNCPNCNWDMSIAGDPDPSHGERMNYLQSILGGKPFTKSYLLFDDQMEVVFRELSQHELDTAYRCATTSTGADDPKTVVGSLQLMELAMRYRLSLQLRTLRTTENRYEEFPHSLAEWSNDPNVAPEETLKKVREHVYDKVIKTESLSRVLTHALMGFNHLVQKLEVSAHRENFWKTTNSQQS